MDVGILFKPHPYDKNRDGFALGEGAGILVIEELEHARSRGAHIYAEISGYGQATDANKNIFALNSEGRFLKKAINQALTLSGIPIEKVDYINSHGTSTQDCDEIETAVIKEVFGEHAYKLIMSSTKPITGHSIGAIGGIEAIITSLAIENSIIPPTIKGKANKIINSNW
jgi:3-oxoacyl-[acyl-carrier-protein] synthase II